jgi:uncharacterized protein YtpQ (UPF0354 family)
VTPAQCRAAVACVKPSFGDDEAPDAVLLTDDDAPVLTDLHNGLLVAYLFDAGDRFAYVQGRDLAAAGLSREDLHDLGVANLAQLAAARCRLHVAGPVFAVVMDGNFEASLILVDDLWAVEFSEHTPNGCMVAIPARDILAFCDAESDLGRAELRAIVQRVTPLGDHLISERLYRRHSNGRWSPITDG